jgi:ABC-type multidrug transport system ATPase subunit
MLEIVLDKAGKRYRREWVFRSLTHRFSAGTRYAVEGPNGSGKSTLMQVLSGFMSPTEGEARFLLGGRPLPPADMWRYVSIAAPYAELLEELTLGESIEWHRRFKPFLPGMDESAVWSLLGFAESARTKYLRQLSSGTKQRLKLALAVCSDTPLLLLDEPTITLDAQGVEWFHALLHRYVSPQRLVVIASNVPEDFVGCTDRIRILDHKGA